MADSQRLPVDPDVIDEIADRLSDAIVERVVEAIRAEGIVSPARTPMAWLDAQQVAQQLGVSREWVYEHADELGASRIGSGPRPRLRFPPPILDPGPHNQPSATTASLAAKRALKPIGLIPIHPS
jgi:hypothetical protein